MSSSKLPSTVSLPHGDQQLWDTAMDVAELQRHVQHCRADTTTTKEKGARLEQLMCWLIPHIPGFEARLLNEYSADHAQEIDVVFWNYAHGDGFPTFGSSVIGECKNWTRPVDSSDVAWFDWKMRLGGVSHGILIAANGVTIDKDRRGYATSILTSAVAEERSMIVLTLDEIEKIGSTTDLRNLIIDKLLGLSIRKPFG